MSVIILDRDGVINFDSADYIKSADEWQPIPGSIEAIAALHKSGYKIYVATNQAGLARGLFDLATLESIHLKFLTLVEAAGGKIERIFFCPHHPDEKCKCRKPGIGMLEQIASYSGENLKGQHFVGDSMKDIEAGLAMGCHPVLVLTGNGKKSQLALVERNQIDLVTVIDHLQDLPKLLASVSKQTAQ